jgi:hypothetical protein
MMANEMVAKYLLHYVTLNGWRDVDAIQRLSETESRMHGQGMRNLTALNERRFKPEQIIEAEDTTVLNLNSLVLPNFGYAPALYQYDRYNPRNIIIAHGLFLIDVELAASGQFQLQLRGRQGATPGGLISCRIGSEKWADWLISETARWEWAVAPFSWELPAGRYSLMIACRDPVEIDQIRLASVNSLDALRK